MSMISDPREHLKYVIASYLFLMPFIKMSKAKMPKIQGRLASVEISFSLKLVLLGNGYWFSWVLYSRFYSNLHSILSIKIELYF
jgi:hypothetical protein